MCRRTSLKSFVKEAHFLAPCAEILGSGPELYFFNEDLTVIPKQVTSDTFWGTKLQSLMTCCGPLDAGSTWICSTQVTFQRLPRWLIINSPLGIQGKPSSLLWILFAHTWGLALWGYLLSKGTTLGFLPTPPSASLNPQLATKVRNITFYLWGNKVKYGGECRTAAGQAGCEWGLTLHSMIFFLKIICCLTPGPLSERLNVLPRTLELIFRFIFNIDFKA